MEERAQELEYARELMKFTGKIAWPTISLFAISLSLLLGGSYLGYLGVLPIWLVFIFNIILIYLLFTPMHEAAHQNVAGKHPKWRGLENLIGWISGIVLLIPFPLFKFMHLMHHKHTNDPVKDPDYWVASNNYLMLVMKCLTIYFKYMIQYIQLLPTISKKEGGVLAIFQSVVGFAAVVGIVVWSGEEVGYQYPLLLWIGPTWVALGILAFAFDWLPHHPHNVRQKYLDTQIVLKPGLTTLLVSQNMHLIHHLYAGLPYYHYGNAFRILRGLLEKKGSPIRE